MVLKRARLSLQTDKIVQNQKSVIAAACFVV